MRLGDRLIRHIAIDKDGCWPWQGAVSPNGYGVSRTPGNQKQTSAHRVVYEWLVGPIPEGMTLDHLCRRRECVNPTHLEPVTMRENNRRGNGWSGRNARKTHCPQGHPYDERNTYRYRTGRYCRACMAEREALRERRRVRS